MALPTAAGYRRATTASAGGKKMPKATPSRAWPASSGQNDGAAPDRTMPAARQAAAERTRARSVSRRLAAPPMTLKEEMPTATAAKMAAWWDSSSPRSTRTSGNSGEIMVSDPPRMKYSPNR